MFIYYVYLFIYLFIYLLTALNPKPKLLVLGQLFISFLKMDSSLKFFKYPKQEGFLIFQFKNNNNK
jgi:hypothetical protein